MILTSLDFIENSICGVFQVAMFGHPAFIPLALFVASAINGGIAPKFLGRVLDLYPLTLPKSKIMSMNKTSWERDLNWVVVSTPLNKIWMVLYSHGNMKNVWVTTQPVKKSRRKIHHYCCFNPTYFDGLEATHHRPQPAVPRCQRAAFPWSAPWTTRARDRRDPPGSRASAPPAEGWWKSLILG